jgi:Rrf2 family iron-sulfur cluster assembly transcriptional regulator
MKLELTRRAAYAIRAVITLAREDGGDVVPASTIAREMHIPVRFLPQVLGDLSRAGLVEARLGRSGGYRLTKSPAAVSLLDVIEATEGDTRRRSCVLTGLPCGESAETCDVHELFSDAQAALLERLGSANIADVVTSDGQRSSAELAAGATRP